MTKSQTKDMIWHAFKAVICVIQLLLLNTIANMALDNLLFQWVEQKNAKFAVIPLLTDIAIFIALWWYYDHIDDFSFNRFCQASDPPNLLRDPGFLTGHVLTVLGATPILTLAGFAPLRYITLPGAIKVAIAVGGALLFVTVASLIRITHLNRIWSVQKNLRSFKDKKYKLIGRIIYALIYFGSLSALVYSGITIFFPIFGSLFNVVIALLKIPFLILLGILVALEILRYIRRILGRRKFLHRLAHLRDKGEISYEIHGHPYRSLFGFANDFHLTITDYPHPDSKHPSVTTYQVAVANCHRRRFAIVLCENHVYQFMYTVNIRIARNMAGGIGMMRAGGVQAAGMRTLTMPTLSWFINHDFDFPKGEGEQILLLDPVPYTLCLRGTRDREYLPLDNASKVYGYTVYGKNSFLNMLERT